MSVCIVAEAEVGVWLLLAVMSEMDGPAAVPKVPTTMEMAWVMNEVTFSRAESSCLHRRCLGFLQQLLALDASRESSDSEDEVITSMTLYNLLVTMLYE